jgi:hypothetical protein
LIVSHNKRGGPFYFLQLTLIIPPKKVDKGNEKLEKVVKEKTKKNQRQTKRHSNRKKKGDEN